MLWENYFDEFSLNDVVNVINSLDRKKDCGPMNISIGFIKDNIDTIAPELTNIFNAILETGKLPQNWNESFIIPIPKKCSFADVKNYRFIAIQSCISKMLDKLLTAKLQRHVQSLLPSQQHGLMKHRGTVTN